MNLVRKRQQIYNNQFISQTFGVSQIYFFTCILKFGKVGVVICSCVLIRSLVGFSISKTNFESLKAKNNVMMNLKVISASHHSIIVKFIMHLIMLIVFIYLYYGYMIMSDREPTRWQHNRIYPYPINLCVYTYDSICHLQISI